MSPHLLLTSLLVGLVTAQTATVAPTSAPTVEPTASPTFRPLPNATQHDPSSLTSLPFCVRPWAPFCSNGCNQFDSNTPCYLSGKGPKCSSVVLNNIAISETFDVNPCYTITGDYPTNIFCRIDPKTGKFCLRDNSDDSFRQYDTPATQECFRPHARIDYTFASTPDGLQPYRLALLAGTCDNVTAETPIEEAQYYSLCSDKHLTQANDGSTSTITVLKYGCVGSDCGKDVLSTYTLQQGVPLHTEHQDSDAFGMLLTGKRVCFSWPEKETTLFDGISPSYEGNCWEKCIDITSGKGSLKAQYEITYSSYQPIISKSYNYVVGQASSSSNPQNGGSSNPQNGESSNPNTSSGSTIMSSLLNLVACLCFYAIMSL